MQRQGNKTLEEKFRQAFNGIEDYEEDSVRVKASFGLVVFRGDITSKKQRLEIITAALKVMDNVLGEGHRRIRGLFQQQ